MIDLTLERGALSPEGKAWLLEELAALLLELEDPPHRGPVRPITTCFVDEVPPSWSFGDRPLGARPVYRIVLSVPEYAGHGGPARAFRRERLVQRVTELVLEAEGTPITPSERLRVRVQVREVRAGYAEACGEIVQVDDLPGALPVSVGPAS